MYIKYSTYMYVLCTKQYGNKYRICIHVHTRAGKTTTGLSWCTYVHCNVRALYTISTATPSHTTSTYWLLILPSAEDGTHHLHQFICFVDCELERLATLHKTHCNTLLVFTVHLKYIRELVHSLCRDGADTPIKL